MKTLVVINSSTMGRGDDDLGRRILQTLLGKVRSVGGLDAIVLYNSGVKLLAPGSPMLPQLGALEDAGVEVIACGTCVDHFEIRESIKAGTIGSMDSILSMMSAADKVITL